MRKAKQFCGWVRVGHRPAENTLSVTVSESLLPVLPEVLARIKNLFDLYCEPKAVYETLQVMNTLQPGLCVLGTRLPGCFNVFEMSVRAVLGQQITVKAASTLAARLVAVYGTQVQTGIEGLTHSFPAPAAILALGENISEHLGKLGIISARANTIYQLARVLADEKNDFGFCGNPEEEMQKLQAIRGIGSWTAQYIAMRAMGWPDAFLPTDAGIKKALPDHTPKELQVLSEAWRPWRSYLRLIYGIHYRGGPICTTLRLIYRPWEKLRLRVTLAVKILSAYGWKGQNVLSGYAEGSFD